MNCWIINVLDQYFMLRRDVYMGVQYGVVMSCNEVIKVLDQYFMLRRDEYMGMQYGGSTVHNELLYYQAFRSVSHAKT